MGAESLTCAVTHVTVLRYTETVQVSYNEVRMRPRDHVLQRIHGFALITRPPTVPRTRVDYFGNFVHRIDVFQPHDTLEIEVEAVVENSEPREHRPRPWVRATLERNPRLEYVLPSPRVPLGPATASLLARWCGDDRSFDALLAVTGRIREEFRYLAGATTVDSSIDDLLAGGAGVCQDFTHLFIDMARQMGWPARYVSGYVGPADAEATVVGASHAWAEVCGPDRHWVGLDPTHGGVTGRRHLRLAVGRDYGDVPPHRGLFFGSAAGAPPEVTVRITQVGPHQEQPISRGGTLHWQQQQQQQQEPRP